MKIKFGLVALLIICVGILSSCSAVERLLPPTPTPTQLSCAELSKDYINQITQLATQFDNTSKLAQSTSRMNMVTPVSTLQDLRAKVNGLVIPDCAQDAQSHMLAYMDDTVNAYLYFMQNYPDATVTNFLNKGLTEYENFNASIKSLQTVP
jgi:hypothetical protein